MDIVIIGSGNVAYHLAKAFTLKKIPPKQIYGRNESALKKISDELGIPYSTSKIEKAPIYIIAVSDDSVETVSSLIPQNEAIVAHTSGSLPKEILQGNHRKASFYPLQTFSKEKVLDYSKIPFFIEAENTKDEKMLFDLALKLSDKVFISTYEKRKYIHLTAVMACNFTNHLFARAKEIADEKDIPFEFFIPLIDETVEKIHSLEPRLAQTGPAVRNDKRVLELHREIIHSKTILELYDTLNRSIQEMYSLE